MDFHAFYTSGLSGSEWSLYAGEIHPGTIGLETGGVPRTSHRVTTNKKSFLPLMTIESEP